MRSLTTDEVAKRFNITKQALRVRARVNSRHPQPIRVNARIWWWDADELEAFYRIKF